MTVFRDQIVDAIRHLGLASRPVCVHSSMRSFGGVEGGPCSIIDALLDEDATVLVPTFSWTFSVIPPRAQRPERNGSHRTFTGFKSSISVYHTGASEIDADMGALPATVLTYEGRHRGLHPLCSFAAVGPMAGELVGTQTPEDVWAPLEVLSHRAGVVLLMGVDLTKLTLGHLAEQQAGRQPFVRWALRHSGEVLPVRVGGCSDGFLNFTRILSTVTTTVQVGPSKWTCLPGAASVELLTQVIHDQPRITQCVDAECERCQDAVAGGPIAGAFGA